MAAPSTTSMRRRSRPMVQEMSAACSPLPASYDKVAASIDNARATLQLCEQGSNLDSPLLAFADGPP